MAIGNRALRVTTGTALLAAYWFAVLMLHLPLRYGVVLSAPYGYLVYRVLSRRWPIERERLTAAPLTPGDKGKRRRNPIVWVATYVALANLLFFTSWGLIVVARHVAENSSIPAGTTFAAGVAAILFAWWRLGPTRWRSPEPVAGDDRLRAGQALYAIATVAAAGYASSGGSLPIRLGGALVLVVCVLVGYRIWQGQPSRGPAA